MFDTTHRSALVLIILLLMPLSLAAETVNYSGSIDHYGAIDDDNIQLELIFSGTDVSGFYVDDKTGERVNLEGYNDPLERLYLKVLPNNGDSTDIKLVKHISGEEYSTYSKGTVHWIGFLFEESGQRWPVHLVETLSMDKHPEVTDFGFLPSVATYLDIGYDPETGKKTDDPDEATRCISNGIPWLDCQLNYHPVDGCYLTEPQRKHCKKGPFSLTDSRGFAGNCWSYEKGPGIQLPFQQAATSRFNLSEVEVVRMEGELAEAREVRASRVQVNSGDNFLNRPECESASAYGPASAGIAPVDPP